MNNENDPFKKLREIIGDIGNIVDEAQADDIEFHKWYDKLCNGMPSLRHADEIVMTPKNFCKAMRQAWRAGKRTRPTP